MEKRVKKPDFDQRPKISVIIASYNDLENLRNCLISLFSQKTAVPFEVVIADSSDSQDVSILQKKFPGVSMIHLRQKAYPGTARNIAIENSRGDILAVTDTDCIALPGWIDAVAAAHHKHPNSLIGGGVTNGSRDSLVGTAEYLLEFSDYSPRRKQEIRKVLPGCNLSFPRELYLKLGKFSGQVKGSDVVFSFKARTKGIKVLFAPKIRIRHVNRRHLGTFLRNQKKLGRGSFLSRKKLRLPGSFLTAHPLLSFFVFPAILIKNARKIVRAGAYVDFLRVFPLLLLGMLFYTAGFLQGAFSSEIGKTPRRI